MQKKIFISINEINSYHRKGGAILPPQASLGRRYPHPIRTAKPKLTKE
jgi:hypothetical protein